MRFRGLDPRTSYARWGLVAVAIGIVLGGTMPAAIHDIARAVIASPDSLPWIVERLAAFLAYLALTGSVIYGLLLSSKLLDGVAHRPITFALHQDLAAVGVGLGAIHGALLGLDRSVPFSFDQIAVPFAAPYRPLWVGAGQIALYLAVVVVATFYARRRLGQRAWRALHYVTFVAFAGATVHGIAAGSDTGQPWAWLTYAVAIDIVAFLLAYRVTLSIGRPRDTAGGGRYRSGSTALD